MTGIAGETLTLSTRVLVWGNGTVAAACALAVSRAGYPVVLAHGGAEFPSGLSPVLLSGEDAARLDGLVGQVRDSGDVEILDRARLLSASGMPGDFSVALEIPGERVDLKVGAVVAAGDLEWRPGFERFGLAPSGSVISQSRLDEILALPPDEQRAYFSEKRRVAFLGAFDGSGGPPAMRRMLSAALALRRLETVDVYAVLGDSKLAAQGLDKLYQDARDRGVHFFRPVAPPGVSRGDRTVLTFRDPVLRRLLTLTPDLLVVEEAPGASADNLALAQRLGLHYDHSGFPQPDNVHHLPVRTNREGVFVAGGARGVLDVFQGLHDAGAVALAVAELLGSGARKDPGRAAVVDRDRCAICLTCVRACPHGAIGFDDKAVIHPLACRACGICAAECPMEAIQVPGFSDREMESAVGLAEGAPRPRIVAFLCENSGLPALADAQKQGLPLPGGLTAIRVPCAGKVDTDYVLDALVRGADGVLVAGCHPDNCRYEEGNLQASRRMEHAKRLLEEAGVRPGRLMFAHVAANMGAEFSRVTLEWAKQLLELK